MITVPYEVKKALRDGMLRKNYRFVVLNEDGTEDFTIDNDTLVSESVSIDERMCSGDTLKFGLCEGSSLEFQYFNHPNITGRRVQVFVDVEYEKVITEYVWETQASFNNYYTISDMDGDCRLYSERSNAWEFVYVRENGVETQVYPTPSESGTIIELGDVTGRTLMVNLDVMPAPSAQLQLLIPHTGPRILTYSIPMGFFDVKKCSRQASTGIIKATGYNKLQSEYLDEKANQMIIDLFDNPDMPVTFYDIRNVLLDGYEIEKKDYEEINISIQSGVVGRYLKLSGGSIAFKANYGIKSPLNYCEYTRYHSTTSTTGYLYVLSTAATVTLDPTKAYIIRTDYDLTALEQHYYDTVSSLLALSFNVSGDYMSRFINPQNQSTTGAGPYLGWHNFFGVCVEKSDGTEVWFSTIAYNAELLNVIGTFKDLKNITLENCTKITIYTPHTICLSSSSTTTAANMVANYYFHYYSLGDPFNRYEYYADSSLTVEEETYVFTDTNGVPISDTDTLDAYWAKLYKYINIPQADLVEVIPSQLPDITLRDAISAAYETVCQFGQLSRTTDLFSGVELNHSRLYPADSLYPATDLYPNGAALSGFKSMYSKLWADEGNVHKWRNLVITYKGLNGDNQEEDFTLQRTVNADGTDDYNMSDNWLFRNLIWTEEQIDDYADAMIAKMQDMTWFPFEMWCAGLPYLETGDEIEIPLNGESYTSYVLQRQLKGIQNLQDTYINGTLDIF